MEDFGNSVILPGLINTHTHLELTGFEQVTEPDFAAWIRRLRELKTTRTPVEYVEAARTGLRRRFASGVTTVADTGDTGSVFEALAEVDGSGVVYQEVFGPDPAQEQESLAGLRSRVENLRARATGRLHVGVSPHAPYSVSGALFRSVAAWAQRERLPLAVHIAESLDESRLLSDGSGEFAEAWKRRGIPLPQPPGLSPIAWLSRHHVLSSQTLCIHAVRAGSDDIRLMAYAGASVAHCPLSNRGHGHGAAPLTPFLEAGIPGRARHRLGSECGRAGPPGRSEGCPGSGSSHCKSDDRDVHPGRRSGAEPGSRGRKFAAREMGRLRCARN